MAIKHAFVSAKPATADGTDVDGPIWNQDHVIDNGSIATAHLADGAVTTLKIADANVTTGKILDANVTTAKIADGNVTLAKQANLAQSTFIGRAAGAGTGVPQALTPAQATAILDVVTAGAKGLVPAPGASTLRVLRDDLTWATIGALTDGDKGDITVATGGTSWVVDNNAITYAKMQDISATQRVIGRNSAGAGDPQEVTASQLLDWVSSTTGVLLTRGATSWGAAALVGTDADGDLLLSENATPTTPAANKVKLYAADVGGRSMPTWLSSSGVRNPIQPLIGMKQLAWVNPFPNAATPSTSGLSVLTTGTATARGIANTNLAESTKRIGYVSAAGAGSVAGIRQGIGVWWRGNAAGLGGFHFLERFFISDPVAVVATGRMFIGLDDSTAAPTDVDPSTLTNLVGIGCDAGDTTLQLYAAGAAAQARTDLGANFPVNTRNVDVYELILFAAPNGSTIDYTVTRLNTGHTVAGSISAGANLPSNTTMLTYQSWRGNGGTAAAVALDVGTLYIETD